MGILSRIFLWCSLMLIGLQVSAQVASPELRCISVNADGSITLTWIPPSDPNNEFVRYEVFSSTVPQGPYVKDNVFGLGTTSFTKPTQGNSSIQYYYVQSVYDQANPSNSSSSDTLATIFPIFASRTDTTATITWNPIRIPPLPTSDNNYRFYRKIGVGGNWQLLATPALGNETFDDQFKVCSDSIYYKVEIDDDLGCTSVSVVLSDLFEDNTAPAIPELDSITVLAGSNNVQLNWRPSTSPDTRGYIVYYFDQISSSWIVLDTLFGVTSDLYIDMINAGNATHQYAVAAFDTCLKGNPPRANTSAIGTPHRTMYLTRSINLCAQEVRLDWTDYLGWDDIVEYDIYRSEGNLTDWVLITTVDTSVNTLVAGIPSSEFDYFYKIVARSNGGASSSSNIIMASISGLIVPDRHYLNHASVVGDEVELTCLVDSGDWMDYFILERALSASSSFYEIGRVDYTADTIISFVDPEAYVNQNSYRYRVGVMDTCGVVVFRSNLGDNILVTGKFDQENFKVDLSWSDHQTWDAENGVIDQMLYRSTDGTNWTLLGSLGAFSNSYSDDVSEIITEGDEICYQIQAIENGPNSFGLTDTSYSNTFCVHGQPKAYVPNAFRPNSQNNPIFLPIVTFADVSNYELVIYNRWGEDVFSTTDPDQGWDGRSPSGTIMNPGVYVYHLIYESAWGDLYDKWGHVTLIR